VIFAGLFISKPILMDKKAKRHFEKGEQELHQADREMYKPEEDIVSLVVCRSTLGSIENYLKGFLALRGFETREDECIGDLMERCRMLDKKFKTIRIEEIDCRNQKDPNLHCEEIEKLGACHQVADQLDTLMRKKGII
jgi:hypothetical protein